MIPKVVEEGEVSEVVDVEWREANGVLVPSRRCLFLTRSMVYYQALVLRQRCVLNVSATMKVKW